MTQKGQFSRSNTQGDPKSDGESTSRLFFLLQCGLWALLGAILNAVTMLSIAKLIVG
jgi:hypothetical protein